MDQASEPIAVIRFHERDFRRIPRQATLLTHFNIHDSSHIKGRRYLLVPIVKQGYFDGKKEVQPVLDFRRALLVRCLGVKNEISYNSLLPEDFRHSLPNVKAVPALKRAILRRYKRSMAHYSDEKKLALGVGITYLRILHLRDR